MVHPNLHQWSRTLYQSARCSNSLHRAMPKPRSADVESYQIYCSILFQQQHWYWDCGWLWMIVYDLLGHCHILSHILTISIPPIPTATLAPWQPRRQGEIIPSYMPRIERNGGGSGTLSQRSAATKPPKVGLWKSGWRVASSNRNTMLYNEISISIRYNKISIRYQ